MPSSDAPTAVITGAAGFIGGCVVEEFLAHGWRVCALVHRTRSARLDALASEGKVTIAAGDAADTAIGDALLAALAGRRPDAVVHCAGRASDVGWGRAFRRANLESVERLVAFAKAERVPRFTFISTTDVYGLGDFHGETEDELPLRNNTRNPYPESKIRAEEHIRRELPPERWSIVRPAAVWGVGDRTLTPRIVSFLRSSPAIVHFGHWRGANRWPLAHVRNVAAAVFLATTRPETGGRAINVLDDERTTVDEFYRLVASVYLPGRAWRTVTIPTWAAWPFACAVTGLSTLLDLSHPFTDPSLYALRTVSGDLDFSNQRFRDFMSAAGRRLVTRDEATEELRATT